MTTVEQPDLLEQTPEGDTSPQSTEATDQDQRLDPQDELLGALAASTPEPPDEWQTKMQQAVLYWQERAFRTEAWLGRHFGNPWLNNFRDGYELPLPPQSITDPDAFTVQMDVQPKGFTNGSKDDPALRFVVQLSADADSVVPHMRRLLDLAQLAGTRITFSPAQSVRPLGSDERQQGLFEGPPPEPDRCQSCGASSLDEFMGPVDVNRRLSPLRCLDTAECDERARNANAALDARIGPDPEPEPESDDPDESDDPEPEPVPVASASDAPKAASESGLEATDAGSSTPPENAGVSAAADNGSDEPALTQGTTNGWGGEPPPPPVDEHVSRRIRRKASAAAAVGDHDAG